MRWRSRTGTSISAAALCVVMAGCTGSPSGSGTSGATPSAAATTTTVVSSSAPSRSTTTSASATARHSTAMPSPKPTTASPGSGGAQQCSTADLTITAQQIQPAGGTWFVLLHLRNDAAAPCRTGDYPGVAVLSSSGRQLFQATRNQTAGSTTFFTLRQGQTASAVLQGGLHGQPGGYNCPTHVALLLTPPNNTKSVTVQARTYECAAPSINPLVLGMDENLR